MTRQEDRKDRTRVIVRASQRSPDQEATKRNTKATRAKRTKRSAVLQEEQMRRVTNLRAKSTEIMRRKMGRMKRKKNLTP